MYFRISCNSRVSNPLVWGCNGPLALLPSLPQFPQRAGVAFFSSSPFSGLEPQFVSPLSWVEFALLSFEKITSRFRIFVWSFVPSDREPHFSTTTFPEGFPEEVSSFSRGGFPQSWKRRRDGRQYRIPQYLSLPAAPAIFRSSTPPLSPWRRGNKFLYLMVMNCIDFFLSAQNGLKSWLTTTILSLVIFKINCVNFLK